MLSDNIGGGWWEHMGIELDAESFRLNVEADEEDYPMVDFSGKVEFEYFGLQL